MKGGFVHNCVLLDPIEAHFLSVGAKTHREKATGPGRNAGFVDLFIEYRGHRIACEAELTADRVVQDVEKATSIRASLLMIVAPQHRIARRIRAALSRRGIRTGFGVWILPLGPMLHRVRTEFPLISSLNDESKSEDKESAQRGSVR